VRSRHVRLRGRDQAAWLPNRTDRRPTMTPAPLTAAKIDFIGAGWSYPLGTDATGGVALVTSDRELEQAIRLILGTACGERPMRPEFGCRIHDHVFNTATMATAGQIAYDVRQALDRWEPRIDVLDVGVSFDAKERGRLYVDISYQVRGLNDPRNLVFPFYVIPSQQEPLPALTALPSGSSRPNLLGGGL
jgi:phage baseplate assembly protein W